MIFFKTRLPVEPVSFIHKICQDTADGIEPQRCRFVKRLTPLSAIGKVAGNGLKDIATEVLAPHFHKPEQESKKVSQLSPNVEDPRKTLVHAVLSIAMKTVLIS